jgi:hypothetical protein
MAEKKFKNAKVFRTVAVFVMMFAVAVLLVSCSKPSAKADYKKAKQGSNAGKDGGTYQGLNLNCVLDHLQNPPDSFHYVYKKDTSENVHVDQEADITPQSINGFRKEPDGTLQPVLGTRSDQDSWRGAIASLVGISGMSSTIAIVNHSSAMQLEPDKGQVNGYDTVHYSIDTARFSSTERGMLLKPGDSEKGDAWVTAEGCPVKMSLDSELHRNDGSLIEKIHYEEAMIKK